MTGGVSVWGALDAPLADGVRLEIASESTAAAHGGDWRARPVDADDWAALERLAARTLVPETTASRLGGAGPGAETGD
jgi:hypothetical protein